MNIWPKGYPHVMNQDEHAAWNSYNYPGTRQLCSECNDETDRCDEDSMYVDELGPLCENCYNKLIRNERERK